MKNIEIAKRKIGSEFNNNINVLSDSDLVIKGLGLFILKKSVY
jgi:hypothetical protein